MVANEDKQTWTCSHENGVWAVEDEDQTVVARGKDSGRVIVDALALASTRRVSVRIVLK